MKDSQLLEILQTLDAHEQTEFRLFVQSPYFNRGSFAADMPPLLEILLALLKQADASEGDFEKENIHAAAFPGEMPVKGKLEKRMSKLLGLLRHFLAAQRELKTEDDPEHLLALAEAYVERKLFHRLGLLLPRIEEKLNAVTAQNRRYFWLQFRLALVTYDYEQFRSVGQHPVSAMTLLRQLWLFYQMCRLEILSNLRNMKQVFPSLQFLPSIKNAIEEPPLPSDIVEQYPVLALYDAINSALQKEKPERRDIEVIQEKLMRHATAIHEDNRRATAAHLRNLCSALYRKGDYSMSGTLFRLYKEHLETGIFYQIEEGLTAPGFQSIVNIALEMNELDWLRQFLTEHEGRVHGDNDAHDFVRLGWAKLLAYERRWQEAYDILPTHIQEASLHFTYHRLELMILFELKSPLLKSRMDSFKIQLSRLKGKVFTYQSNAPHQKVFLNIMYQLTRNNARTEKIRAQINALRYSWEKKWLLEKVEALPIHP